MKRPRTARPGRNRDRHLGSLGASPHFFVVAWADDRQSKDHRQVVAEMIVGVVQDAADGRVGPAHHPLHAIGGGDEVTLVDAL